MDIITTLSTKEIVRQHKCQTRFLDKLIFKQDVDNKSMINVITCSILESPPSSDYDDMDNGV